MESETVPVMVPELVACAEADGVPSAKIANRTVVRIVRIGHRGMSRILSLLEVVVRLVSVRSDLPVFEQRALMAQQNGYYSGWQAAIEALPLHIRFNLEETDSGIRERSLLQTGEMGCEVEFTAARCQLFNIQSPVGDREVPIQETELQTSCNVQTPNEVCRRNTMLLDLPGRKLVRVGSVKSIETATQPVGTKELYWKVNRM